MNITSDGFISIDTKNGEQKLKKAEYARWLCLLEAMHLIEQKGQDLKVDMNNDDFWVKPLAFQKYIDQRLETMLLDVEREEFKKDFNAIIPQYIEKKEDIEEQTEDLVEVGADLEAEQS